jgi:hypothetical protein
VTTALYASVLPYALLVLGAFNFLFAATRVKGRAAAIEKAGLSGKRYGDMLRLDAIFVVIAAIVAVLASFWPAPGFAASPLGRATYFLIAYSVVYFPLMLAANSLGPFKGYFHDIMQVNKFWRRKAA